VSGRLKDMPCGHVGECVAHPSFYVCLTKDCDGRPSCTGCGSKNVEPFESEQVPLNSWHCWKCGKILYRA
jgi:hypothetical protein